MASTPYNPSLSGTPAATTLGEEVNQWVSEQVPYLWGGASQFGADCSGYVQQLFSGIGINVGRTTYQQVTEGTGVAVTGSGGLGAAQPGDVLFFDNNSHEGLYLGNGMMTDEPHTGGHAEVVPVAGYGTPDAIRNFGINPQSLSSVGSGASDATLTSFNPLGSIGSTVGGDIFSGFLKDVFPAGMATRLVLGVIGIALLIVAAANMGKSSSATDIVVSAPSDAYGGAQRGYRKLSGSKPAGGGGRGLRAQRGGSGGSRALPKGAPFKGASGGAEEVGEAALA